LGCGFVEKKILFFLKFHQLLGVQHESKIHFFFENFAAFDSQHPERLTTWN